MQENVFKGEIQVVFPFQARRPETKQLYREPVASTADNTIAVPFEIILLVTIRITYRIADQPFLVIVLGNVYFFKVIVERPFWSMASSFCQCPFERCPI